MYGTYWLPSTYVCRYFIRICIVLVVNETYIYTWNAFIKVPTYLLPGTQAQRKPRALSGNLETVNKRTDDSILE